MTGRPTLYTDALLAEVVERLAQGEPLAQICRDEGMPAYRTVWEWQQKDAEVSKAIAGQAADVALRVEIYGLYDPRTGELRYVGKANDSKKRFATHLRDSRRRHTPVYAWVRKLAKMRLTPEMRVLEIVPADRWEEAERRLIAAHASPRLLNLSPGGEQPFCPPAVRRANARLLRLDPNLPGAAVINRLAAVLKTWHGGNRGRTAAQIERSRELRATAFADLRFAVHQYGTRATADRLIQSMPWLKTFDDPLAPLHA